MAAADVHGHRVRVVALSDESQPPQSRAVCEALPPERRSAVRRLVSTPAFTLTWAASMPVAGGGLAWYAVQRCFVC